MILGKHHSEVALQGQVIDGRPAAAPLVAGQEAQMQTRVKIIAGVSAAVLAAAGLTTGLVLSARSGPDQPGAGAGSSPGVTPGSPSPFTGEPVPGPRLVLAVKIDNLVDARPQTGVSRADIVYVLPVEGGLSGLMAVFSSAFPPVVGPVRSARLQDLEVLRQFGRPAFAYSGAAPTALPTINRARIVNLRDGLAHGYFRDNRRAAPHNLYAHTSALRAQAQAGGASEAHSIGFRFGPAPGGGKPVRARVGVLPGCFVPVHLVRGPGPLARVDGRVQGRQHRGRAAVRGHGGHPVHRGHDPARHGAACAHAVREECRLRSGAGAARRRGLPGPLVAANCR